MADGVVESIKIGEAISLIKESNQKDLNSGKAEDVLEYQSMRVMAILEERMELRSMRLRWSNWILGCIVAIVVVDFILVGSVGFGLAKFPDSFTLPAFLGESIINIIGLAVIIVKFLFSDKNDLPKE